MQRTPLILFLILAIPFVDATILTTHISGTNHVEGYARMNDELLLEVRASIDNDASITPNQVRITTKETTTFPQTCRQTPTETRCLYTEPIRLTGTHTYTTTLHDDDNAALFTQDTLLTIDEYPPSIISFTLPATTASGALPVQIHAQDFAEQLGDTTLCSGISSIKLFLQENNKTVLEKTFPEETCTIEETLLYIHESRALSEQFTLCAEATDALGQTSTPSCQALTYDREPPKLASLTLHPTSALSSTGGTRSIGLTLLDASPLDTSNIIVNLENITGTKDLRTPNRKEGNTYFIDNIFFSPTTQCGIALTATDALGNILQTQKTCTLIIDDEGPDPLVLKTNVLDPDGGYLISTEHAKIIADITETGAGLSPHNVFLNLYPITGESKKQADSCTQTSSALWRCTWENLTITSAQGAYSLELLSSSTDDLGNTFQRNLKEDMDVAPLFVGISDIQHAPANPSNTDILVFSFFVTPLEIQPAVWVNTSAITADGRLQQARCTPSTDKWQCTLTLTNLKPTEQPELIEFVLSNEQGYTTTTTYPIHIYEANPAQQDFFTITGVRMHPKTGIDRKVASTITAPLVLQPYISTRDEQVEIIAQTVLCNETFLAETPQLITEKSKTPLILLKLDPVIAEEPDNIIKMNCYATLYAKKQNTIYTTPELENFTIKIPLYNNPLGTINESTQQRINSINAHIENLEEEIQTWSKANNVLGKLAGIGETIAQVDATLSTTNLVVAGVSQALMTLGKAYMTLPHPGAMAYGAFIYGIGETMWGVGCNLYGLFHLSILLGIWKPGPPLTLDQPLPKLAALVNSCQLCRHTGLYTIPVNKITGPIIADIDETKGIPTTTEQFTQYLWEPQRSIHVASLCLCPQGIEYNLKKERQLSCIYRNCIKEHAKQGLPLTNCDKAYTEQNCLYIESAGWKVGGGNNLAKIFARMYTNLLAEKLPELMLGLAWKAACDPFKGFLVPEAYRCGVEPIFSEELLACSTLSIAPMLLESRFLQGNQFEWDQYNTELLGEDYC